MLKDKKIKRKIDEAMKPDVTYREFCKKHDIEINEVSYIKQESKVKMRFCKILAVTAAVFVVFLGVFLPLQLSKLFGSKPDGVTPKMYGELSVDKTKSDINQIYGEDNLLLFNMANVESILEINRISPKEDDKILLGYHIKNVLYGFYDENELYGFDFDYLIRNYKYYSFLQEDLFNNLNRSVTIDKRIFSYNIRNGINGKLGYISFSENDVEYFIILRAFNNMLELNDENVIVFLQNIFTEETESEKINYKSE